MKTFCLFFKTFKPLFLTLVCIVSFTLLSSATVFAQADQSDRQASAQKVAAQQEAEKMDTVEKIIAKLVYQAATGIGGFANGLGGLLLDASIDHTVLRMGEILGPTASLGIGVQGLWKVIRDILNILFIFGLISIGIKTILNSEDSGTRRDLGYLIIAALVINFSLYITQAVVDFSNIAALQVHQQIIVAGAGYSDVLISVGSQSVAGAFLQTARISSFFDGAALLEDFSFLKAFVLALFMMIFLIVAGIVFAMGAILLISRFIALTLYMVFSPVMFIGWIYPAFSGKQEEWRSGFLKQAFFAPAFFFMLYLSLVVLQKLGETLNIKNTGYTNMLSGGSMTSGSFTIVLFFCLMIGFLWASIKVAQMMGTAGASGSMKMLQQTGNWGRSMALRGVGGATAGMAARVGRTVIGSGAQGIADSDGLKDAASKRGFKGWGARMALGTARYAGDASFDGRKIAGMGKSLGIGEGAKGGYKTIQEGIEKREKEYAKSLGEVEDDDTTVNRYIQEKESLERELAKQKDLKEREKDPDKKADIQKRINDTTEAIKKQEEIIKQEKARRQVGSHVDPATNESTMAEYAEAKKLIKDSKSILDARDTSGNPTATKEEREDAADVIKAQNDIIKELKQKAKVSSNTTGYAGVHEQSPILASLVVGRTPGRSKAVGKAIRKQFAKGHLKEEAHKHDDAKSKKEEHHDEEHAHAEVHAPAPKASPKSGGAKPAGGAAAHH